MRLTKIKLFNFRCFGPDEQTILIDNLTTFIGNNSAGKTAALSALNCMFSENSNDRLLHRSDFHLPKEKKPEEMEEQSLYVEAVFQFDELEPEGQGGEYAIPYFFQHMVVESPGGMPCLRIRLSATWRKSSTLEGSVDSQICYITCPESEEILENHRVRAQRHDLDKIRVIYVPAVRDPSKQLKNASGSLMYQIMNSINWSDETKDHIKTKVQELNTQLEQEKGVSIFGNSIAKQWKEYDSDNRYSTASLRFSGTDIETSIRNTAVVFEPTVTGKEYTIDQMGDGLRSLFYISLVDSVLDVEEQMRKEIESDPENTSFNRKPPILTIVALEEPENHIAPHLLGKLVGNLQSIAGKPHAQAIITSHSPAILKRIEPKNLRYFRLTIDDTVSKVRGITLPSEKTESEQYKYIKEAIRAYPELYFAKLVILGEGESEELILPKFWETVHENVDLSGISIVPLGGRHVNHFWRLLHDLQIPFITLLDLDRERDGGGWGRIKYALTQLLQIGVKRESLLNTTTGIMSDDDLGCMHDWGVLDTENMQAWMNRLEEYHVFFSAPLDIDFLMLEHMGDQYKKTLGTREGPRITVEDGQVHIKDFEVTGQCHPKYDERIKTSIRQTLKENGGNGETYTDEQKKLMIWYSYFFLNRGKPASHIAALSSMSEDQLKTSMPPVLSRLITVAEQMLKGEAS